MIDEQPIALRFDAVRPSLDERAGGLHVAGGGPDAVVGLVRKSHDKRATALCEMGHQVSASSLPKLLEALGYRRHVNRKTKDGGSHPGRDAQFECINAKAREFQAAGQPVISVDTKKK